MGRINGYKSAPNLAEKYTTRTNSWKLSVTSSKLSIRQGVFIITFILLLLTYGKMSTNQQKQGQDIFRLRANFELVCLIQLKYKYRL